MGPFKSALWSSSFSRAWLRGLCNLLLAISQSCQSENSQLEMFFEMFEDALDPSNKAIMACKSTDHTIVDLDWETHISFITSRML